VRTFIAIVLAPAVIAQQSSHGGPVSALERGVGPLAIAPTASLVSLVETAIAAGYFEPSRSCQV
jgi:hypothetical protein